MLADGTNYERTTTEEMGADGYWLRQTVMRGVSSEGKVWKSAAVPPGCRRVQLSGGTDAAPDVWVYGAITNHSVPSLWGQYGSTLSLFRERTCPLILSTCQTKSGNDDIHLMTGSHPLALLRADVANSSNCSV